MHTPNTAYLPRLDHLRFLAAALVLMFHQFHQHVGDLRQGNALLSLIDEGHTGIGLFMVISGFILTVISGGRPVPWVPFMRNRVLRIYPLFVLAVFLQLFISTYHQHRNYGLLQLLSWLIPFRSETVPLSPYFVQLWTIWVEFQFYLLFPLLLVFVQRYGARHLVGLLVLLAVLRAVVWGADGQVRYLAYETIFGRLDQFIVGMLLGLWHLQRQARQAAPLHAAWLLPAAVALILGLHLFSLRVGFSELNSPLWVLWPQIEAGLWAGVVAAYIGSAAPAVASAAPTAAARLSAIFASLGMLSFSMYVWHNLIIALVRQRVGLLPIGSEPITQSLATGVLLVLPLTVALSWLTWRVVEQPFLALRRPYAAPQPKATAAP